MKIIDKIIDSIPVSEYYPNESSTYKGLFFLIHGHTCSKESYYLGTLPERLTDLGYIVIAIDADKHGLRKAEPYLTGTNEEKVMAMLEVIYNTCCDIQWLYEKHYLKMGGKLGVIGISMGGHITFQMAKFLRNIDYFIPLIGAPDLKRHYQEAKFSLLNEQQQATLTPWFDKLVLKPEAISKSSKMLIIEGELDKVVNWLNAKDFFHELCEIGHANVHFESYSAGHEITVEMETRVSQFLKDVGQR